MSEHKTDPGRNPPDADAHLEELRTRFTYHAPKDGQKVKYEAIRRTGLALAELFAEYCPRSREHALAVTKLEEAIMWANASIARRG